MARFIYRMTNKKNKAAGDCAVNALCLTIGGTWLKNYRDLCKCGEIVWGMPSEMQTIEKYMSLHHHRIVGFTGTVEEFADAHPEGKYCVISDEHMTAVVDGSIYDQLNPLKRKVIVAFEMTGK